MSENNGFLLQQNQTLNPPHTTPNSHESHFQNLTTNTFIMERGPKYNEYSALRNKRLKIKISNDQQNPEQETSPNLLFSTPQLKKQVKYEYSNFTTPPKRPKSSSVLTQSVPDFSSALRKENRKPKATIPRIAGKCMTPPTGLLKSGGIRSTNASEKRNGGMMGGKSFASVTELKRLDCVAGNVINGGGKIGRGIGKSVLGNRQFEFGF